MIRFDVSNLINAVRATIEQATPNEEVLRAATFAGAEVFREAAKRNEQAHIRSGTTYRSVIVKRLEEESDGHLRQVYKVTVRKGRYSGDDAFYFRFVEQGHKFVPRKKSESTTWAEHRRLAELEFGSARAPAYPIMRPAYESSKAVAVDAMTKKLREQVEGSATT